MKTILRSFATYKEFIQFMEYPSCNQCIHFMEYIPDDTKNIPRSLSLCKNEHLSKCKKFGYKNIMSGKIFHEFAEICRNDEKKCGVNGTYYKRHHGFFN